MEQNKADGSCLPPLVVVVVLDTISLAGLIPFYLPAFLPCYTAPRVFLGPKKKAPGGDEGVHPDTPPPKMGVKKGGKITPSPAHLLTNFGGK